MVRTSGEVIAMGLHKFFNLGQLKENKLKEMAKVGVLEVLEKLNGQMIMGVVVGDFVEYWSRKGKTPVAVTAINSAG